jgi:HK97 family phage prohead protease
MSTEAQDIQGETERAERPVLRRTFEAEFTAGDGRTVDVRIVPYGVPATVSDDGGRTVYREEWQAGAFDDQLVAGHRLKVLLNFEHRPGIGDVVGKGISLRSASDGLHGSFRMSNTQDGEKALELVNDGILDSVSLEAFSKNAVRTAEGVVRRVKAHLYNVALCRQPAFPGASVLAVREQPENVIDEELLPSTSTLRRSNAAAVSASHYRSDTRRTPRKRTPRQRPAPPKRHPSRTHKTSTRSEDKDEQHGTE